MNERQWSRLRARLDKLQGINLGDARRIWIELGGTSRKGIGNGEEIFSHPYFATNLRCGRHRTAPRTLCNRIRELAEQYDPGIAA